jgi:hypothetical protein
MPKQQSMSFWSQGILGVKTISTMEYVDKHVSQYNLLRVWRQGNFFKWKIQMLDVKEMTCWIYSIKDFQNWTSFEWDMDLRISLGIMKMVSM